MVFPAASYNALFRRCVTCGPESPSCPDCAEGTQCALIPPTCDECQSTQCVATTSSATISPTPSPSSQSSGPNSGAIAGGVIAGVLAIAAVTYLVWRYCIKTKRQQYEQDNWVEEQEEETAAEKEFTMRRDARASTHTVASIASTVLTRASNIIQIAYIPGVTNRSQPSTPGLLVPPVPPIPIALSSASTPRYEQEHFFMPGDLRDSTYSGISDRTSYARTSVASTIYGKNAVVSPVPAQTVIRGKAAVVSVKSNGPGTPGGPLTPPVPNVDYGKYGIGGPPSPAFSVGSTFLNSTSAATATPATQVKPNVVRVANSSKKSSATSSIAELDAQQDLLPRDSNAITIIDDTPTDDKSPFKDPPANRRQSSGSLSALIEDSTRRAQRKGMETRGGTPFGDEHEVRE